MLSKPLEGKELSAQVSHSCQSPSDEHRWPGQVLFVLYDSLNIKKVELKKKISV